MKDATNPCPPGQRMICHIFRNHGEAESNVVYRDGLKFGCVLMDKYKKEIQNAHIAECLYLSLYNFGETAPTISLAERRS